MERDIPGFRPEFRGQLAEMFCAPDTFGHDLARGGTLELIYRGPAGNLIENFTLTASDC